MGIETLYYTWAEFTIIINIIIIIIIFRHFFPLSVSGVTESLFKGGGGGKREGTELRQGGGGAKGRHRNDFFPITFIVHKVQ